MADTVPTLPPAAPVPQILPPPAAPSTAQVVSAAVQNVVACLVVGAAWLVYGKIGAEVALPVICLIVGIDFVSRKKLPGTAAGAVAIGATGALNVLGKFPLVGAALVAALTMLGLGCGLDPDLPIKTAKDVVNVVCVADAGVELPSKVSEALDLACVKAQLAIDAFELGNISVDQLLTAMQEVRRLYEAL